MFQTRDSKTKDHKMSGGKQFGNLICF